MTTLWESHHEYFGGLGLPTPSIPSQIASNQRLAIPIEVAGNSALWVTDGQQDADGSDFWSIEDEPFTPPVRDALSDEG